MSHKKHKLGFFGWLLYRYLSSRAEDEVKPVESKGPTPEQLEKVRKLLEANPLPRPDFITTPEGRFDLRTPEGRAGFAKTAMGRAISHDLGVERETGAYAPYPARFPTPPDLSKIIPTPMPTLKGTIEPLTIGIHLTDMKKRGLSLHEILESLAPYCSSPMLQGKVVNDAVIKGPPEKRVLELIFV